MAVNRYPEIERLLRELADHTEQVTPNPTEARVLRNTLVQLLAERPPPRAARSQRRPLESARRWWRGPRAALRRARAHPHPVEALCAQVEAELERTWELSQRLSEDGRAKP